MSHNQNVQILYVYGKCISYAHVHGFFFLPLLYERVCEKHVCLWGRAVFFSNHSNDLTQLELRLGCLAFFSAVCARFSVIYIFPAMGNTGASCDPDGTKVCMFPTNLQYSSKPKTTVPFCMQLAGILADANSLLCVNSTPKRVAMCAWCSCLYGF